MKFTAAQAMLLAGSAMAMPTELGLSKRALTDADILNFALTLEHLESTFYKEALAKFPQAAFTAEGAVPRLRFNIEEISNDEANHVAFLTSALKAAGATPVQACTYDFSAAMTDVTTFLAYDAILEGVGVSAYLGAAASIANKDYLTAAGSILTVEARHDAYIRDNQMAPGPQSPFPGPFDVPLDPMQVFTLASQFIKSCPTGSNLPFKAFPSLTIASSEPAYLRFGNPITLDVAQGTTVPSTAYCIFPAVAGPYVAQAKVSGSSVTCTLPAGVPGESYVVLSKSKTLSDADTIAGPAILKVQAGYTYPGFPM